MKFVTANSGSSVSKKFALKSNETQNKGMPRKHKARFLSPTIQVEADEKEATTAIEHAEGHIALGGAAKNVVGLAVAPNEIASANAVKATNGYVVKKQESGGAQNESSEIMRQARYPSIKAKKSEAVLGWEDLKPVWELGSLDLCEESISEIAAAASAQYQMRKRRHPSDPGPTPTPTPTNTYTGAPRRTVDHVCVFWQG